MYCFTKVYLKYCVRFSNGLKAKIAYGGAFKPFDSRYAFTLS